MNEFLAAHIVEVSIGVAVIAAVAVFVGRWLARRSRMQTEGQDKKLREHFEQLQGEITPVISLASSLAQMTCSGKIVGSEQVEGPGVTLKGIKTVQMPDDFTAHFPEQADRWMEWEQSASEHNTNCENFRWRVKSAIESKGIPVEGDRRSKSATCVYNDALDALFSRWQEIAGNNRPWPDFQNIDAEPVDGGSILYLKEWRASAIAFADSEDGQEKCKIVLGEVSDDVENQKEAAKILDAAGRLVNEARSFAEQVRSELDDIDKSWSSRKENKFKRLMKTCPGCKELL